MKVLIVPMSAMAETAGTASRSVLLGNHLRDAGVDVALCAAIDINYKPIEGIKNYELSVPMPLGLPKLLASRMFPIAQKLGLTSRKTVKSFEDVLHLTGNINDRYLKQSIREIQNAIRKFQPDIIYSEFNISAIIAARLEEKKLFITASYPTQYEYSSTPRYAEDLNKVLKEYQLPAVRSCLELFSWADKKFVPSCYELEPFHDEKIVFCGTWKKIAPMKSGDRDKIVVYMGNGTVSQRKMMKVVQRAFCESRYQVYIAGNGLKRKDFQNIHIAPYFDFSVLLPEAAVFINHGGQNSIADGLLYGLPQIICAGKVFERRFNAQSIVRNHAGIEVEYQDFSPHKLAACTEKILSDSQYQRNAAALGEKLVSLGGIQNIVQCLYAGPVLHVVG